MPWYRIISVDETGSELKSVQSFKNDRHAISYFRNEVKRADKDKSKGCRFQMPKRLQRIVQREITNEIETSPEPAGLAYTDAG